MYLLGLDIGSSSIKAALVDGQSGQCIATATSPGTELPMISHQPGWAEQHPDTWWEHIGHCITQLRAKQPAAVDVIKAIGISYQMHGLVCVDANGNALRPAIIWCDSRAVPYGEAADAALGTNYSLQHFLNSPGNFTASKLKWVKENEPELYARILKVMLPGDYIAFKLGAPITTSISGLSEGIFWDYQANGPAKSLLEYYGIDQALLPTYHDSFGEHGAVSEAAAAELGIPAGAIISYRAGDQPNNALALNVLKAGEVAANAGTSGVIYGITEKPLYDHASRVNTFVHVNHTSNNPHYGVLACINGTGILNSWVRKLVGATATTLPDYVQLNELAMQAPVGSGGLRILPFGNGAERTLENQPIGGSIHGLDFNQHSAAHLLRATQEGIVFALNYGLDVMRQMGMHIGTVRAGAANMFLSPLFRQTFADAAGVQVELYDADGAQGAARAAAVGAGLAGMDFIAAGLSLKQQINPGADAAAVQDAYAHWHQILTQQLNK